MLGGHAIKHWSSTQASVSLRSGEAEFAGVILGAGQGLVNQALLKDLGVEAPLRVWTDSSAAIGICSRQGLGKLRHLDTHTRCGSNRPSAWDVSTLGKCLVKKSLRTYLPSTA